MSAKRAVVVIGLAAGLSAVGMHAITPPAPDRPTDGHVDTHRVGESQQEAYQRLRNKGLSDADARRLARLEPVEPRPAAHLKPRLRIRLP